MEGMIYLVVGCVMLAIWILVLIAILRVPGLLINIAKEIKKSREQAHHDAVTLAEVLSEAIGNSSEEACTTNVLRPMILIEAFEAT